MSHLIYNTVQDVVVTQINQFTDNRGWLSELWRSDQVIHTPVMAYISATKPSQSRGPHEHVDQTDLFIFIDGKIILFLADPKSYKTMQVGSDNKVSVLIPPGVAHGYMNVGESDATIINIPNRLYRGYGGAEKVDEIRYEHTDSRIAMLARQLGFHC